MSKKQTRGFMLVALWGLSLLSLTSPANAQLPSSQAKDQKYQEAKQDAMGICPPINLLDDKGNIIDPIKDLNANVPYSPKATCGKCHDHDKITKGYHFQQGKGEEMTKEFQETYPWCTSPGQYGGRW